MASKMRLEDDKMCFACGKDNPIGLHLDFKYEGKTCTAEWTPKKEYQGYKDVLHGGIISTALDEAMTRMGYQLSMDTVTGHIEVTFKKPAFVNKKYTIKAEINEEQERKVFASAWLLDNEGSIVAEAKGILVKIKQMPEQ